jgi:hypothetical protein
MATSSHEVRLGPRPPFNFRRTYAALESTLSRTWRQVLQGRRAQPRRPPCPAGAWPERHRARDGLEPVQRAQRLRQRGLGAPGDARDRRGASSQRNRRLGCPRVRRRPRRARVPLPRVAVYLFHNLEAAEGVATVAAVERFLDRIAALRDGKGNGITAETARAAVELLATRKILDAARETELRALITTVRHGARPDEVVPAPEIDPKRAKIAQAFVLWINEWREVARIASARRDTRSAGVGDGTT